MAWYIHLDKNRFLPPVMFSLGRCKTVLDGYRYTMFITPTNKGYILFSQSEIANIYISWNINPCQMANMDRTVGIG